MAEEDHQKKVAQANTDFEREKWNAEASFRDREVAVKEAEVRVSEKEQELKELELKRSRWSTPLIVAILGATAAAIGNAAVALINGQANADVEGVKAEASFILEVIKTSDEAQAANNVQFLIAGNYIDPSRQESLKEYLKSHSPVLPARNNSPRLLARRVVFEACKLEGSLTLQDLIGALRSGIGSAISNGSIFYGADRISVLGKYPVQVVAVGEEDGSYSIVVSQSYPDNGEQPTPEFDKLYEQVGKSTAEVIRASTSNPECAETPPTPTFH